MPGQPSAVLGQTMSPPWSLLSLLTKSLTNYCLMEEGCTTESHPASTTKQSFQVTTSLQLSLLRLSAWTNSQLHGLSLLKPGKAAGLDDLLTEMLQHFGNNAKSWLLDMLNECTRTKHIPSIWRKAKVIATPKPGKDPSSPKSSYRPISLLCIPYTKERC